MRFNELDTAPSGNKPLTNVVRWLRTCLAACTSWNDDQRAAASQAVDEAEALLATELNPSMSSADWVALTARDLDHQESPLTEMLRAWREDGKAPTYQELLAIHLYESRLRDRTVAMRKALGEVSIRIAFIGWPAETHWRDGEGDRQRWVPDWRDELETVQAALHGRLPRAELQETRQTLPWNRIPEEFRPGHQAEGRQRLNKLHLAYLNFKEEADAGVYRAKTLVEACARVFDKQPAPGAAPDLLVDPKVAA